MKHKIAARIFGGCMAVALAITGAAHFAPVPGEAKAAGYLSGSYSVVVVGYDWGPGVSKLIIKLNRSVKGAKGASFDKKVFSVSTKKQGYENGAATVVREDRKVLAAYTSDAKGKKKTGASQYITLDLECSPSVGNPFFYSTATSLNNWSKPMETAIRLKKTLKTGDGAVDMVDFYIRKTPGKKILKGVDDVFVVNKKFSAAGETLRYAYHESDVKTSKKGLVIWLHGTGEGGRDTRIPLYGNKVTNLAGKTIQKDLKGCDILVAQCPTRWLSYTTGINTPDKDNPVEKYQSPYTATLKALIDNYVKKHHISKKRIYIGGASNGGSMTMNMLLNYPDYFSAAYFASEGYADRHISDTQIEQIKHIPMWFVYAEGDQTNDPAKTTRATYDRLKQAGASNIHLSYYANGVVDKSGKYKDNGAPHRYSAHWSWVYLLNNNCKDGGTKFFRWLGNR